MTKEEEYKMLAFGIIRTILWFNSDNEMPSDEEILKCYDNAIERFNKITKEKENAKII